MVGELVCGPFRILGGGERIATARLKLDDVELAAATTPGRSPHASTYCWELPPAKRSPGPRAGELGRGGLGDGLPNPWPALPTSLGSLRQASQG